MEVNKKEFFWNMAASMFAAALSAVLLMIVTRVNGVEQAGVFAIAFANATVLNAIADYGMRVYQVTDSGRRFDFWTYLLARIFAVAMMVLAGLFFVWFRGYTITKAAICILLVFYRVADGLSETFQGEFQLNKKLDVAGKSVVCRIMISTALFLITDIITKDILAAHFILFLANVIVFVLFDVRLIKGYVSSRIHFRFKYSFKIIIDCFPVFLSTFLNIYIVNAPKYAIDRWMTNADQAYFSYIYLPSFTINLVSIFILKPMLTTLGNMWKARDFDKITGIVLKMSGLIAGITLFIELVCVTIGIPILNLLSGLELNKYRGDLLLLVLSGGLSAIAVMLFYALTTMRCQSKVLAAYGLSALTGLIGANKLVEARGINGAAIASIIIMSVLLVILYCIYFMEMSRQKTNQQDKSKTGR